MNPGSLEGHRPPFAKFRAILGCQGFVMNILPGAGTPPQGLSDKLARRSVAVFSQCTGLLQPNNIGAVPEAWKTTVNPAITTPVPDVVAKTQSATKSGLFMRASKDRKTC